MSRYLGRSLIPMLIQEGFSAAAGLRYIRDLGVGYREKIFRADWNILKGSASMRSYINLVDSSRTLSSQLVKPRETKIPERYVYKVEIYGYDDDRGKYTHRYVTLGDNFLMSPDEAVAAGMEIHLTTPGESGLVSFQPEYANLIDVYENIAYA